MAILTSSNLLSEQRYNISDARRIESGVRNDFDTLVTGILTNTSQGYVIRGFSLVTSGAIGSPANSLQMIVDPGAVLNINASVSGTIFQTPIGTTNQILSSVSNGNVVGSFTANSINYVGIDYYRFADSTTNETKYIWNSAAVDEIPTIAPAAQTLTFKIYITTTPWALNVLPIAIVETDSNGNVNSVSDARWMYNSLETGGVSPNPSYVYPWGQGRVQPPVTTTSNSINPFIGGDKQLGSDKEWKNAIMSILLEIKGTPSWFTGTSGGNPQPSIISLFQDLGNTVITGSGNISNGILPNSTAILTTTGNITQNSNQLTSLGSTSGIADGDYVFGTGIPQNTTIVSISGSTVTMSQEALVSATGRSVTFYSPASVTSPGQINWDQPISIRVIGSELTYTLSANASSTDISLSDDEAAYVTLVRDQAITPNLIFIGGSPTVVSVGSVSWTSGLQAGDYIRVASNTVSDYYEIETVNSSFSVTLTTNVNSSDTSGSIGTKALYAFGSYTASASPSTNRNIYIASRDAVPVSGNVFWLFLREDNGGFPRVYIRFLSQELDNGESVAVSGTTSKEILQYIGAPTAASSKPSYSAALYPGSVPQISNATVGAGSTISAGQYFLLNSSANAREYAVWFRVSGSGSAPAIANIPNTIQVNILSSDSSSVVATELANTLNSSSPLDFSAVAASNGYVFTVTAANATVGATYTNNGQTFTVSNTIVASTTLICTGTGAPSASGTLTKTSGTGDSTIAFSADSNIGSVQITNTSAGAANPSGNGTVSSPFTIYTSQAGTGVGNYVVHDGDNLTLAIKELDVAIGNIQALLDSPTYDETIEIVSSGATPPTSLTGPISVGTNITLPNNSREGSIAQQYTVGAGTLQVFLNGQFLDVESGAYTEVGTTGLPSIQIQTQILLVVGDELELRIGGSGGNSGGGVGPAGPDGPAGPAGKDALNGPIPISTKTSSYTVLLTDGVLLANCASGAITFTLPSASSAVSKVFYFKKIDSFSNAMTIAASGSDLIDGISAISTTDQWKAYALVSNGTVWYIL